MNAILLIGGFGTRLRPLTLTRPKALLPVLNRPFLSYQLDILKEAGVTDVMLACGIHTKPWKRAFAALAPRGMKIHFAFEPNPLGTGGAIRFGYDRLKKIGKSRGSVLVFNGDVFFDLSVRRFIGLHDSNRAACTVALTRVKDPSRFGLVEIDKKGAVRRFLEKPKPPFSTNLINAGAYLMEPKWIESIPTGRAVSVERESFPQSLKRGERLFGFVMSGYWNDIGTHQSYLQAHRDLMSGSSGNNRWTARHNFRKRGLLVGPRSSVSKSARLEGFVCCGEKVVVEKGATLRNCVVLDGCRIGENAVIEEAVLGPSCRIGDHARVGNGSVLGAKTFIPSYTRC
jgi:mannose-1-phosphate guanylyltransferase